MSNEESTFKRSNGSFDWGELAASLEDQYEDDSMKNGRVHQEGDMDSVDDALFSSQGGHFAGDLGLEADANLSLQTMIDVARNEASIQPLDSSFRVIKMRKWINRALRSVGETDGKGAVASFLYMRAAIKIALSLIDLMSHDEHSLRLSLMSNIDDLAGCVMVRVKQNGPSSPAPQRKEDQRPSQFAKGDQMDLGSASDSSELDDVDYLNVDSVEFRYHSDPSTIATGNLNDETQRIFYLGLVLYELFSGGHRPPAEVKDLSSSDGAFASLRTCSRHEADSATLVSNCERHHGATSNSKRHHGATSEKGVCLVFEHMRLHGVTSPLCRLVHNMFEYIHGDMSGDESSKLSDVRADLNLMFESPKFLQDLDTGKLSLSGLQLNEIVIPRIKELEDIQSSYRKFVSGSSELAIIKGASGTGKSWLLRQASNFISKEGGIVLSGKFELMKEQAKPFSALTAAFDDYCEVVLSDKTSEWAKCVAGELKDTLGRDAHHLFPVIPKLSQVLDDGSSFHNSDSDSEGNCMNCKERLHHLLCKFVEVICSSSKGSITLVMDDMQWSDGATNSVLKRLLSQEKQNMFFLCCCRANEMEDDHSFWTMTKDVCVAGANRTTVELTGINRDTLSLVLSNLFLLPPRIVRPLRDILYSRTKGNILFVLQLLNSLTRDGCFQLDMDRKRWAWDMQKIHAMKLPENVAMCLASGINKLPSQVQSALRALSLIGSSSKQKYIEVLQSNFDIKLIEPLLAAAKEGLVSCPGDGSFHFSHDRIQQTCYEMIEEQERLCNHLEYGKCLMKSCGDDTDMLYTAMNLINLGTPAAVSDETDYAIMAEYNLKAGKKAMEMDYVLALNYFDNGISFLRKNHWKDHYHLSLELYELAAQCCLAKGSNDWQEEIRYFSHQILNNARNTSDKLNIYYTIMTSLMYASKIEGALDRCTDILSLVGESIPNNLSSAELERHIKQTRGMINAMPENDLEGYKKNFMTDKTKLMTMRFYSQLNFMYLVVRPHLHLQPYVAIRMIQMTISDGVSPISPIGFSSFAGLLINLGLMDEARRCITCAKSFLSMFNSNYCAGEALSIIGEVSVYLEPMQSINELQIQGEKVSLLAGNVHWACMCRVQNSMILVWSGIYLPNVAEKMTQASHFFKSHGHDVSLVLVITLQQLVNVLTGDTKVASAKLEEEMHTKMKNPRVLNNLLFHNVFISFFMKQGDLLSAFEKFYESESQTNRHFVTFQHSARTFIIGLVAFQLFRETNDPLWADRGREKTKEIETWAKQGCAWNFMHKYYLLVAEESWSTGNFDKAKEEFSKSIVAARQHKFINDEALACECAAKFYLEFGDRESSLNHFRLAHQKYTDWGAIAKAELLFAFANEQFDYFLN